MKALPLSAAPAGEPVAGVIIATGDAGMEAGVRDRARAFAEPLLAGEVTASGENLLAHADADVIALQEVEAPLVRAPWPPSSPASAAPRRSRRRST